MNSVLYDAWAACAGQWAKSTFLDQKRRRQASLHQRGTRRDGWTRCLGSLPRLSQFLTLLKEREVDEHCEEVDRLFSCLDGGRSSSSSSSRAKAKAKKQKRGSHQTAGNSMHRMAWLAADLRRAGEDKEDKKKNKPEAGKADDEVREEGAGVCIDHRLLKSDIKIAGHRWRQQQDCLGDVLAAEHGQLVRHSDQKIAPFTHV